MHRTSSLALVLCVPGGLSRGSVKTACYVVKSLPLLLCAFACRRRPRSQHRCAACGRCGAAGGRLGHLDEGVDGPVQRRLPHLPARCHPGGTPPRHARSGLARGLRRELGRPLGHSDHQTARHALRGRPPSPPRRRLPLRKRGMDAHRGDTRAAFAIHGAHSHPGADLSLAGADCSLRCI